jgi:6-phosphogluconolactonase
MHRIAVAGDGGAVFDVAVHEDAAALTVGAAAYVAARAAEAIAERGRFSLVLSGGSTPRPIYERLAETAGIDWARVDIFFGDERCVPPDDPRSNTHMARAAMLDRISIPPANIHRIRGEEAPDDAAVSYADELRRTLGGDGRFDLVLLGLGDNGHTASLFPGLAAVTEDVRPVAASYVEVMGMWRVTLTPPAINGARDVAFVVAGGGKAEVLHRVLQGPQQKIVLPAQAIRPTHGTLIWLVDAAAAADLRPASAS